MSTKVRLVEKMPKGHPIAERCKALLGKVVEVGKPVAAGPQWRCGTDLLWPVLDEEALRIAEVEAAYVCRHVIEAGD